ncbi:MAG TPA: YigZ family protein [Candidatus Kapabacteria bacterium]|nr:YigZ family protein [Candidatus Kapabacteria bacterium]
MLVIPEEDKYFTIAEQIRTEIKIKGSKFICTAIPTTDVSSTNDLLKLIRQQYFDATHNCFAYKLNSDGAIFRYSDDGEPSGSAGKPILFTINKYNFTDILVVVTRFFGGTKLGVGGLVRAYSDSAEESLKLATPLIKYISKEYSINCSYKDVSLVKRLILPFAISQDEHYFDSITINIKVPLSRSTEFEKYIYEKTEAKISAIAL